MHFEQLLDSIVKKAECFNDACKHQPPKNILDSLLQVLLQSALNGNPIQEFGNYE